MTSTPITMIYPDADDTQPGLLYLPGAPVFLPPDATGCALCGYLVAEQEDYRTGQMETVDLETGNHRGVITVDYPVPGALFEAMHLRCVVDTADQERSVGFTVGVTELTTAGRHAA